MRADHLRAAFLLPVIVAVGACVACSQDLPVVTVCQVPDLAAELNGQQVSIRGEAVTSDHDLLLVSENCQDIKMVLKYTGLAKLDPPPSFSLREDANFKKFERLLLAKNKDGSYRYKVLATFNGRLDVSDSVGFIRDKDGKIRGIAGYGSPFPYTRFRLVIQSVSDVIGTPYEQAAKKSEPAVLFAVAPVYPDSAATLPEGGEAVVEVTIDDHGSVVAAQPVWGNPVLHEPSLKAAKRWLFNTSGEKKRKVKLTFSYRVISDEVAPDELTPVFTPPFHVEVRRKLAADSAVLDTKDGSVHLTIPVVATTKTKQ